MSGEPSEAILGDPLAPGSMVGEYRIDRRLGGGAMGVVYSATQPIIEKRAAVKVLRPEVCTRPAAIDRFIDEARAVNRISHPNIVDIFSFGRLADGRPYFVMELLDGESLRARMVRGDLELPERIDILQQVCRALEATHAKGIVHRDLKPDNIFLARRGDDRPTVKLLDFGIAKLTGASGEPIDRTQEGVLGTPLYIAPEQACGKPVDGRADIYALGVIAYELFLGRPPFLADEPREVLHQHVYEAPPEPSSLRGGIPPSLERLMLSMLAKSPAKRPAPSEVHATLSALEAVGDASAQVATEPMERYVGAAQPFVPEATPLPTPMPTPEPTLPRQRRGLWLVSIGCGVVPLLLVALSRRAPDATRAAPPLAKPAVVAASPPVAAPTLAPPSEKAPAPVAHPPRRAPVRHLPARKHAPLPADDDAAVDPFGSDH